MLFLKKSIKKHIFWYYFFSKKVKNKIESKKEYMKNVNYINYKFIFKFDFFYNELSSKFWDYI